MDRAPRETPGTSHVDTRAWRWVLGGRVQGVGFRPFVYRLAHRLGLSGWVLNRCGEVEILAQGSASALEAFGQALVGQAPPLAIPRLLSSEAWPVQTLTDFTVLPSNGSSPPRVQVPPDYFTCPDCLAELEDPGDRRYRYPFINCTQCGPRYTLIRRLPYDRSNTSMAGFPLCPACEREYRSALDRRFHAEPIACPACGPVLSYAVHSAPVVATAEAALQATLAALQAGRIVAVKGVGGYHLMCDARSSAAVRTLRDRKKRPHKPLAMMYPWRGSDGLNAVRQDLALTPVQAKLLASPMRPIVLVSRPDGAGLSGEIAPGLGEVGVMLPYTPLHHLLMEGHGGPLVATSANLSGEPVLTDNAEVGRCLGTVADAFLHHDRPIQRPADDPVFREIAGRMRPLRLGRGCAPAELDLDRRLPAPVLALGGQMKSTVALAWERRAVISPHIGDLDAPRSLQVFRQVLEDLQQLYGVRAEQVVCDAHPGYSSSRWARGCGLPVHRVWHHHAHASALAGEHPEIARWLVLTWDGVGLGEDGTLWGGETLLGAPGHWRRVATLRPFALPGGERAGREPWRSAAALCWETQTHWSGLPRDATLLHQAWQRGLNCHRTSAAGRLFDAAAALLGLLQQASFEGQGPAMLEARANASAAPRELPLAIDERGLWVSDWAPLVPLLLDAGSSVAERAAAFHASLAAAIVAQVWSLRRTFAFDAVGLCGGVLQNRLLSELASTGLRSAGFEVRLTETLPCNDAGLSFGQVIEHAGVNF